MTADFFWLGLDGCNQQQYGHRQWGQAWLVLLLAKNNIHNLGHCTLTYPGYRITGKYLHTFGKKIGSGQTGDKQLARLLKSHLFQSESIIFSATELTLNIITHVNMDTCGLHGLALNNTYCRVFRTLEFYPCQTIHQ